MSTLTDETLLKRATHAGRNLRLLAMLASVGTLVLAGVTLFATGAPPVMAVLTVTIALITAGYWVLAVAAARGNPNSVGIVVVLMALQITLSLVASGVVAARNETGFRPNVVGLIIPVLVLIGLGTSRKVLLELKTRGLWQQVFGTAKPSQQLCVVGGALLAVGFAGLNTGTVYIGWKAGQQRGAEMEIASSFSEMIHEEESQFLQSMRELGPISATTGLDDALDKLDELEQRVMEISSEKVAPPALDSILRTYIKAVRQRKNGLLLLKDAKPDTVRAQN